MKYNFNVQNRIISLWFLKCCPYSIAAVRLLATASSFMHLFDEIDF